MSEPRTIITFDEGEVAPAAAYAFELDLAGPSGCDLIDHMVWLINSLKSPFELRARQETVTVDELSRDYTKLTVWTNDKDNADFLWLMHELGVQVYRRIRED